MATTKSTKPARFKAKHGDITRTAWARSKTKKRVESKAKKNQKRGRKGHVYKSSKYLK